MRHSFFRCTAIFILILSLGVGHSWADEITVYVTGKIFIGTGENAWDNATSTIRVDVRKNYPECFDCQDFNGLYNQEMTNTGYTYNGYPIYSYTLNQAGAQFRFKHYKSGAFKEDYTTDWHATTNQIYQGYYSNAHHWITYGRDVTFYATPEKMDGSKWKEGTHTLFANFKYGDGESEWKRQQMTKTAYTYNGNAIYTCTMLLPYNVIKKVQFLYNDGSDKELYAYEPSPQLTANDLDGKILLGWNGSSHNWVSYGRDVTVYTIPDYLFKGYETPYNENNHYPAVCIQMGTGNTWNTVNMTKTSYTYATYPIYKATILIDQNKFWEYQIKYFKKSDNNQVNLYQFNQSEPKTEYAPSYIDDKLYHGYNGNTHDFFSYRYDVALDRQSGGGGSTSIIAIDGSAMPSATMPRRDGYAFGGYWTEPNGGGTQYYNSDGSSTRNWDSRTITTLYAHWTPKSYTITLEGMEANDKAPIKVQVEYDGVLSPVTPHTKTNYTFAGYWTSDDFAATLVTQLIDANGNWIKDIHPYTGNDGGGNPTWIYPNDKSLFAKWTEDLHDVTVAVSPAGAGSVTLNGSPISKVENIGYVTHSAEMTAVPANAAWVFKEWQVTDKAHLDLEHYSKSETKMKITATGEGQTLTAVFEKRYNLVGSKYDTNYEKGSMPEGGMPGFAFGSGADFTIHSYTADGDNAIVNMSCTRTLEEGVYIFEIHDRKKGASLGRKNGDKIYVLNDGGSVELQGGEHQDRSIFFYPQHEGQYTFRITYMRKDGDYYYPTVTVERPHQLHMGHVHAEIDNTSATNSGDTGGTLSATIGESPISNDEWYNYGADIAYTASPVTGYTAKWYIDNTYSSEFSPQPPNSWTDNKVTHDENVYVRFTEKATTVTLSNDGHGHVEIDGMTVSSTTVGVTTHRKLTAVPDEGYKLNSWIVSGDDIALSSKSTNPTTLSGLGAGAVSGQEVRANFVERWALSAESEGWGHTEFTIANITVEDGKAIGYVDIALPANTDLQFKMVDKQTGEDYKSGSDIVYYMTNGNSYNWSFATEKAHNCGITTAGAGTYRFIWNITDKTMSVIYPNFVIYRTGDQGEDSESATHTTTTTIPVESYLGGTISEAIEFRMKVRELDKWYTLCLPFVVNKVCVWDNVDGAYYDIVPYYRPTLGGTFYTGHYIIRKPVTTTDFAIEGFEGRDRWIDPESPIGYLPSANTPYIIQWHDQYFDGKYISFFGDTNQDIPSEFKAGERPSANDVVNIFGNNTMHSDNVMDAYLLDKDYGPSGAWLREAIGTDRKILPFECFILANDATTTRYRILRRGMEETDTPTALEQISNHQSPMTIRVYTITGVLIGEYNDCSFQDAAHRIATDYNEGIYILRSENESMKLLLGGK